MTAFHERTAWRGLERAARAASADTAHSAALAQAIKIAGSCRFPVREVRASEDARDLRKAAEKFCRASVAQRTALAPDLARLADLVDAHLEADAASHRRARADIDG